MPFVLVAKTHGSINNLLPQNKRKRATQNAELCYVNHDDKANIQVSMVILFVRNLVLQDISVFGSLFCNSRCE